MKSRIIEFIKSHNSELLPLYQKIQNDSAYWDRLEQEISGYCIENQIKFKTYFRHGGSK